MELLSEISDVNPSRTYSSVRYLIRRAARVVLLNEKGEVALLHSLRYNYYKLPGGGIEGLESIEKAAQREALEEIGCKIKIDKPLGLVIEYRNKEKVVQISYCFLAHLISSIGESDFTAREKTERFKVELVKNLDLAIRLVENKKRYKSFRKYLGKRDTIFLKKARLLLHK